MKKDYVTLNDCKFTLLHNEGTGFDGVVINVKVSELSQIQRLIAKLGGAVDLFNTALELPNQEPETLTWLSYNAYKDVIISAHLRLTEEQYKIMLAGFSGNNSVYFYTPQQTTMIDDTYLVLPDDRKNIKCEFRESQSKAIPIQREN